MFMKLPTQTHLRRLIAEAPVLLIPWKIGGRSRVVPREEAGDFTGIIAMSPLAIFFQQVCFACERIADRARFRRLLNVKEIA